MPANTDQSLTIRPATPADVPTILRFIREHAEHVKSLDKAIATEADLLRDGFSLAPNGNPLPTPQRFRTLIADWTSEPNRNAAAPSLAPTITEHRPPITDHQRHPVGFALFFPSYSTWVGHHGLRLEDLYVTPPFRGHGIGKALLRELAGIAVAEGCSRLEWDVLTWNTPAIAVYTRLGATTQEDWRIMRLTGAPLLSLAAGIAARP